MRARAPYLSKALVDALGRKERHSGELTNAAISELWGCTPEHVRKILAGEAFPSRSLLQVIANQTNTTLSDLEQLLDRDRWNYKHGRKPPAATLPPDTTALLRYWDELRPQDKNTLLCVAECLHRKLKRGA